MNIPERCDVVVIGGGPAGATAGALLASQGFDVALLEKAHHPRYAVGESLIPHFWKYCDLTGASEKLDAEGFISKAGGTVSWNGTIRQMAFKDFGYPRPALHVERDRFDHIVLENTKAKGCAVFEGVAVREIILDENNGPSVVYRREGDKTNDRIRCRFVIDASGQGALLAKQFKTREIDEDFRFMSIWGYFKDSKYVAADGRAYPFENIKNLPPTTFVSNIDGWSWTWHIPLREETSVGLILPREQMQEAKSSADSLEAYFVRKCSEIPILDRLLESAKYREGSLKIIRDYSYRPARLTGPGYFLAGDAAAFVDPIFSVGVTIAMYSAAASAWAIARALKNPERTASSQEMYETQFLNRLELARALALPRYGAGKDANDKALSAVQFETTLEQELIYVASSMTTRNENYEEMIVKTGGERVRTNKYRILEEVTF